MGQVRASALRRSGTAGETGGGSIGLTPETRRNLYTMLREVKFTHEENLRLLNFNVHKSVKRRESLPTLPSPPSWEYEVCNLPQRLWNLMGLIYLPLQADVANPLPKKKIQLVREFSFGDRSSRETSGGKWVKKVRGVCAPGTSIGFVFGDGSFGGSIGC